MSLVTPEHRADRRSPHILLCGCGPGELMGWAFPILDAAARAGKSWQFSLLTWPRWLPSRRVVEVARAAGRFHSLIESGAALGLLAGGRLPTAWDGRPPSLLLHLGGPPTLSIGLAARWRRPVAAYSEWPTAWPRGFSQIFSVSEGACTAPGAAGTDPRCLRVGELLVDAVAELRVKRAHRPVEGVQGTRVGFFPGSRPVQLRHYLPRILPLVRTLTGRMPSLHFLIARSPFVTDAMLRQALGPATRILSSAAGEALVGNDGLSIPILAREEVLCSVDLLVCTPGTTTAEAAALGIPMLVVAPLGAEFQLFSGMAGTLERTPWLGKVLKGWLLKRMSEGLGYYAHPNVRAQRALVPELQGAVDLGRITEGILELVGNGARRQAMAAELMELMGPPGAAERLVSALDASLR